MVDIKELLTLKKTLRCNADGKFKILFLADLHGGKGQSPKLAEAIECMTEYVKPDLMLLGGDTSGCRKDVHVETPEEVYEMLKEDTLPFEKRGIPWAHVFGNHDENYGCSREEQEKVYESFPNCVSKAGDPNIQGVGNYVLPILSHSSDKVVYNIWGMDSHDNFKHFFKRCNIPADTKAPLRHGCHGGLDYDTVRFDQLLWYYNCSKAFEEYNGGEKVPGLMYMHMAVPEFLIPTMNRVATNFEGHQYEEIGCGELNSGLFSLCLERGDVKAIFVGHDHINDFCSEYCGITLAYMGSLNYDGYNKDELRGARVLEFDENDPWHIKTYMVRLNDIINK